MNFKQFVWRNTLRNKQLYAAYFFSTLFAVMVFFTFSVFAFHPTLTSELNQQVQVGMLGAAIIIYGFSFFFVLYSMGVFLQSRKKEFGLLMVQGMSPRQLRKMVFIENLVIGIGATFCGSLVGVGFSQGILLIARKFLGVDFNFYLPVKAFVFTLLAFAVLFLLISFFIQFRLPKLNLQELLKADELGKGSIHVSRVKGVLAGLLIGVGYAIALFVPGAAVWLVFLPVVFLVILGTKFLFEQSSILLITRLKKRKNWFWKKTNMVVFSDLAFRMKDNAQSFFLVAVISTVAFAAIGTLYGVQSIVLSSVSATPFDFQTTAASQATVTSVNDLLAQEKIDAVQQEFAYYQDENNQYILANDYNRIAALTKDQQVTQTDEAYEIENTNGFSQTEKPSHITLGNTTIPVTEKRVSNIISSYMPTFIVPENSDVSSLQKQVTTIWKVKNGTEEAEIAVGIALENQPEVFAAAYTKDLIIKNYAPVLFVGIFIGIVFFVSAASFLYFRLYSDLATDIAKFKMVYKLGLSKKELKKIVYQQVAILFFTPIIVSFVHGAVALTAMYHMFDMGFQVAGGQVLGAFVLIQITYYLVARMFYFRKVFQSVQN